ncbi:CobW family GTP-binding protein [Paenibacillus alkalitolerans]|uniref:CobW family GTP-binding protein n=1 Tax=Paenibacillus alkalitolerans TaxID=2799335 RepID=UPI0018F5BAFA|nr:GTP-binding protein [Paenibacillus alkalitolerans]
MKLVPVYVLSGFLGSGKTTLLTCMLDYLKKQGKRPAVVMNEIGDVNLDGMLVDDDVPMAEMLSGCICCTVREDLSLTLLQIVQQDKPDVIVIESTGIANPMELLEGITNASLIVEIDLKLVITVVSAPHFLELARREKGKTMRLMEEQIRCADLLLLNKTDLLAQEETRDANERLKELNSRANLAETVRCSVDLSLLNDMAGCEHSVQPHNKSEEPLNNHAEHTHHHTHSHVMAYTHHFDQAIDHKKFEKLFGMLPPEVYRAKGIIRFAKDQGLYLFQYAYRELEIVKINPQQSVQNVAVFIGEHFDKEQVRQAAEQLLDAG